MYVGQVVYIELNPSPESGLIVIFHSVYFIFRFYVYFIFIFYIFFVIFRSPSVVGVRADCGVFPTR